MAEYIDRDTVIEKLCDRCGECLKAKGKDCAIVRIVDKVPAADVAPVVHAHWIREEPNGANGFRECLICSKCHQPHFGINRNYCPYCGAHMDERSEDNG